MKLTDHHRSTKFVLGQHLRCMPELLAKMVRNRVSVTFEDGVEKHLDTLVQDVHNLMVSHCEDNNLGLWSYEVDATCWFDEYNNVVDESNSHMATGTQVIHNVFFELTSDADKFVNNFLVYHKLAN